MKISAKGRYALASMICLAQESTSDEYITIVSISKRLGISKIYLEQVFSLLKGANLVESTKGASGGYQLALPADKITVYDILASTESTLFEKVKPSLSDDAQNIERAITELVHERMDDAVRKTITKVTLQDLTDKAEEFSGGSDNIMYYI